jgi:hypothetical protein
LPQSAKSISPVGWGVAEAGAPEDVLDAPDGEADELDDDELEVADPQAATVAVMPSRRR